MKTQNVRMAVVALLAAAGILCAGPAARALNYTWDGNGDGVTWSDPLNWTADSGYPSSAGDFATINSAASINTGNPIIGRLYTGAGTVTLTGNIALAQGGGNTQPTCVVGTGGLTMTGSIAMNNGSDSFSSAGNVAISGSLNMSSGTPTQSAGTWDIGRINLPWGGAGEVQAWNILDGANTVFGHSTIKSTGNITWSGTPNISGGRPDWYLTNAGNASSTIFYDVGAYSLYGDVLQLDTWTGNSGYCGALRVGSGGQVDVNSMAIGTGRAGNGLCYVDIDSATVNLRGTGTVYDNRSTNNTLFDMATGTTVIVHDDSNLDTGSKDRGGDGLDVTDFDNNFAFGNLTVKAGVTATVTGNANIEGGGNTALYVKGALALEDDSTLQLTDLTSNRHNAYLNGQLSVGNSPGTATINGGDFAMTPNASFAVEIAGLTPGSQHDQLIITGAGSDIALAGTLTLDVTGAVAASVGDLIFIISNEAGTTTGLFQYAQGAYVDTFYGKKWAISYSADLAGNAFLGGNDVALMAIPEPASAVVLGLTGLLALRRRARAG